MYTALVCTSSGLKQSRRILSSKYLLNSWFKDIFSLSLLFILFFYLSKELVFDSRNEKNHSFLVRTDLSVEVVPRFKYLATAVDSKLSFIDNIVAYVYKKAQLRLCLFRRFWNLESSGSHVFQCVSPSC